MASRAKEILLRDRLRRWKTFCACCQLLACVCFQGNMSAASAHTPAVHPAADAFDPLPVELLALILEYLPLRPRLRVAARVSRRWHTAALRTVHTLDLRGRNKATAIAASYPCITDLHIELGSRRITALPPTLRHLRIADDGAPGVPRAPAPLRVDRFPDALAALSLVCTPLDPYLPLLRHTRTLLTKLCLPAIHDLTDAERDLFLNTHIPSLERLSLRVNREPAWLFALRHRAQLRSLRLVFTSTILGDLTFSERYTFDWLEKMSLAGASARMVLNMVDASPRLHRLNLEINRTEAHVLQVPKVVSVLHSLVVGAAPGLAPLPFATLAMCPKLRHVDPFDPGLIALTTTLAVLRFASLTAFAAAVPPDGCLPHLTELYLADSVDAPPQPPPPPQQLSLPRLSVLCYAMRGGRRGTTLPRTPVEPMVAQLRYVMQCAPHLRTLRINANLTHLTRYGVDQFLAFLRDVALRGVEEVDLGGSALSSARLVAAAMAHEWMHVRMYRGTVKIAQHLGASEEEVGVGNAWESV